MKTTKCGLRYLLAVAGLGGFLYGVDFGVIAAAEPYMKALGAYSELEISQVVGAVLLGGLVSSISAGWLCDFFGRKKMIVASSAMFLAAIPVVCLSLGSLPERWLMGCYRQPKDFSQIDRWVDIAVEEGVDRIAAWTYRGGCGTVVGAPDALKFRDAIGENFKRVVKHG